MFTDEFQHKNETEENITPDRIHFQEAHMRTRNMSCWITVLLLQVHFPVQNIYNSGTSKNSERLLSLEMECHAYCMIPLMISSAHIFTV